MQENYDVFLTGFASGIQGAPFKWGSTDCGSLVRRGLTACYGRDILRGAGSWNSLRALRKFVKDTGGPAKLLKSKGFTKVRAAYAQCGDVVILPGEDADDVPQTGILLHRRKMLTSDRLAGVVVVNLRIMKVPKKTLFLRGPE